MIKKKELEKLPVLPAMAKGSQRYIGRIRVIDDVIVLDVYDARKIICPEDVEKEADFYFRWVCDKKNFYVYWPRMKEWKKQSMYWAMHGYSGWCSDIDIQVDQESQKVTEEFLKGYKKSGWCYKEDAANLLFELENDLRDQDREKRWEQRRNRIKARQERRKPLPKDWDRWLDCNVFKEERYIFYDSASKKTGTCAHCGNVVELPGNQRHNQMGKCPSCGSRIKFKAVKTADCMKERKQTVYLQKTEDGFLTRYIMAEKYSSVKGETYKSYDCVLATWNGKKTWYDYCVVGLSGEYWDDTKPLDMSHWKAEGYLYTRNVRQALKGTSFQYAPLDLLMKHEKKEIPVADFLSKYQNSPFMEFFIKAGLWTLAKEYAEGYETWHGRTPVEILMINKQRMKRLIHMNGGKNTLSWLQYEQEHDVTIDDGTLKWLAVHNLTAQKCENVIKSIGSVTRMANYMRKQSVEPNEFVTTWEDYLRMARQRGMDVTDDIVRFPKNLRQCHDQLVDMENAEKDRERLKGYAPLDQRIQERMPEIKRYYWQNDTYMIIPAGACEELIKEGRSLHHCVGRDDNYMKKMADGKSWICFLRKKSELETPWYTIEIDMKDDHIIQYYSMFNRKPQRELVDKILATYIRNVKRNRKRIQVPVTAIA